MSDRSPDCADVWSIPSVSIARLRRTLAKLSKSADAPKGGAAKPSLPNNKRWEEKDGTTKENREQEDPLGGGTQAPSSAPPWEADRLRIQKPEKRGGV